MPNLTMLIQKMKFITLTLKQNWSIRVYGILLNEIDILLHIKKDTYQGFTNDWFPIKALNYSSVAAKLVKTAERIPLYIHARENKSGRQIWDSFWQILVRQIWDSFWQILVRNIFLIYMHVEINRAGKFGTLFGKFWCETFFSYIFAWK